MRHVLIFLSAVSAEFASYRNSLRHDLDRPNVTVKVQEDFIAGGNGTLVKLDEYIEQCDAVIHLVGDMTGVCTNDAENQALRQRRPDIGERLSVLDPVLKLESPMLSYTQWEAWLALYHRKMLIIAMPTSDAFRDATYKLEEDQRAAQQEHLERLKKAGRFPEISFVNADRLALEIMGRSKLYEILFPVRNYPEIEPRRSDGSGQKIPCCPYRGLSHFDHHNSDFFFGRRGRVEEIARAVQNYGLITVVGASGSGKTSIVLAGLVPELQKMQKKGIWWQFTYFRPSSDPFYALASAIIPLLYNYNVDANPTERMAEARKLADCLQKEGEKQEGCLSLSNVFDDIRRKHPERRLLIIADQLEELYTLCPDENVRQRFMKCLVDSVKTADGQSPEVVLMTTMRASILGTALSYAPFAKAFEQENKYSPVPSPAPCARGVHISLGAMDRTQLREVIEEPAKQLDVVFEGGLVDRVLDDVEKKPGNLPLLEFALTLLWEKQREKQLTHAAYQEIGEIKGALVKHADEKYNLLTDDDKERAKRIFLGLIEVGEKTGGTPLIDTRKRATRRQQGEGNWSLIQKLADRDARLLVINRKSLGQGIDQETVELVHEALIQHWPRLQEWLEESREYLLQRKRIEAAAAEWSVSHRNPSDLLRGQRLTRARKFGQEHREKFPLSAEAREFIEAGIRSEKIRNVQILGSVLVFVGLGIGIGWLRWSEVKEARLEKELERRLSFGEDVFLTSHVNKKSGSVYFASGDYEKAAEKFEAARRAKRNDPEALIYLNNARATTENPLTIAVIVPIGKSPNVAQEILRGVAQAQDEVNKNGGINGRPLQVKIGNDDNDPKIAREMAERMVGNPKILAVVGHNVSDVSRKAAEVYQDNLVMVTPTSFALDLEEYKKPEAENYIFSGVQSYRVLLPKLAEHMVKELKTPRVLICLDSHAYDQARFADAFSGNEKIEVIPRTKINCDFSSPDLNLERVIDQAVSEGANSLFLAPHVNTINYAIDLAQSNQGRLSLFAAATLFTADTLRLGQHDVDGLVIAVYWHQAAFPKHPFYRRAKGLWGGNDGITWRTATAYDATQVIIDGLKKIPSPQGLSGRKELQETLSSPDFSLDGATGTVQFLPSGERKGEHAFLTEVCSSGETPGAYDFVPLGRCTQKTGRQSLW